MNIGVWVRKIEDIICIFEEVKWYIVINYIEKKIIFNLYIEGFVIYIIY